MAPTQSQPVWVGKRAHFRHPLVMIRRVLATVTEADLDSPYYRPTSNHRPTLRRQINRGAGHKGHLSCTGEEFAYLKISNHCRFENFSLRIYIAEEFTLMSLKERLGLFKSKTQNIDEWDNKMCNWHKKEKRPSKFQTTHTLCQSLFSLFQKSNVFFNPFKT